jgi:acetoin utilization deacetylase AcuC-like enzyme
MEKYGLLPQQLLREGICQQADFFVPTPIEDDVICRVHDPHYVQQLKTLALDSRAVRKVGFPLSQQLIDREWVITAGTVQGALKALDNGVSFNIAGGTHHAFYDHGEAFCLLNDQAIAAQYLLDKGLAKQILIVDLDVHQGNGTAALFQNQDAVFIFSMHGAKNYPFKKEKSDLDLALDDHLSDADYLDLLKRTLPELIQNLQPDFIFYLSGVDVLATDKLGRLGLSIEGCKLRDQFVFEQCYEAQIPVQCSMGGGYSPCLKTIVDAHTNTYRVALEYYG